jgi:hypothetical protein
MGVANSRIGGIRGWVITVSNKKSGSNPLPERFQDGEDSAMLVFVTYKRVPRLALEGSSVSVFFIHD